MAEQFQLIGGKIWGSSSRRNLRDNEVNDIAQFLSMLEKVF